MKRILVLRNDKIGDFVLAWPAIAMLKRSFACYVEVLISPAVESLARECPWIDGYIIDDKKDDKKLVQNIKDKSFDVALVLYKKTRNAKIIKAAGIVKRISWCRQFRPYNLYMTDKVYQLRGSGIRSECEFNNDVIRFFLNKHKIDIVEKQHPYIFLDEVYLSEIKESLLDTGIISTNEHMIMIHPGTGGSAKGVSSQQIIVLIKSLKEKVHSAKIVLCGGPTEQDLVKEIEALALKDGLSITVFLPKSLKEYLYAMSFSHLFIAGSTGPLHMASLINIPTVGFYPAKKAINATRWHTLNGVGRHLAFSSTGKLKDPLDLSEIDMEKVVNEIVAWKILA